MSWTQRCDSCNKVIHDEESILDFKLEDNIIDIDVNVYKTGNGKRLDLCRTCEVVYLYKILPFIEEGEN